MSIKKHGDLLLNAHVDPVDLRDGQHPKGAIHGRATPVTIADGLKTSLGERSFAEIQRWVDDIVTVGEAGIVQAMRLIWEVLKIIVEPSGAVSYAGVLEGSFKAQGRRVGIILSGGNVDLEHLPWQ